MPTTASFFVFIMWATVAAVLFAITAYRNGKERDDYRNKYFAAKEQLYRAGVEPLPPEEVWNPQQRDLNEVKLTIEQQLTAYDTTTPEEQTAAQEVEDIIHGRGKWAKPPTLPRGRGCVRDEEGDGTPGWRADNE